MASLAERVALAIDQRFPGYVELLQRLVGARSLLGREGPAQALVAQALREMGLHVRLADVNPAELAAHPAYVPTGLSYEGRPNLYATWPGTGGGRSLVLNGHIDVVPTGALSWWREDPWGGIRRDGKLYGRGALDMKGGLVMGLLALRAMRDAGVRLRGTVSFESVIEEENTGNGTLAARLVTGPTDGAVLLEPTGDSIWTAELGVTWFELTVTGRPAYIGTGAHVNAVEKAAYLIGRLGELEERVNAAYSHRAYVGLARPYRLNVGLVNGGDWPSNAPLACTVACRLGYPPGVKSASIKEEIERTLARICQGDPWLVEHPPVVNYPGFQGEGSALPPDHPLARELQQCHAAETGRTLPLVAFPGTADARYFNLYGYGPALYYGPTGEGHHGPDEYVDLESIRVRARVLARFIQEWCA